MADDKNWQGGMGWAEHYRPAANRVRNASDGGIDESDGSGPGAMRVVSLVLAALLLLAGGANLGAQDSGAAFGIDVDAEVAGGTLIRLAEPLDEPEYYCIDVPGFGARLNLGAALMAHTCKPGAADEMFAVNQPAAGNLSMPAYTCAADGPHRARRATASRSRRPRANRPEAQATCAAICSCTRAAALSRPCRGGCSRVRLPSDAATRLVRSAGTRRPAGPGSSVHPGRPGGRPRRPAPASRAAGLAESAAGRRRAARGHPGRTPAA